jgi:ribosomal protein L11 methyltransferase
MEHYCTAGLTRSGIKVKPRDIKKTFIFHNKQEINLVRRVHMNDKWLRIDLSAAPELTDVLANFLEEMGAEGVYQEFVFPPSLNPSPETEEEPDYGYLTAYISLDKKEEVVASLGNYLDDLHRLFPDLEKATFQTREITAPDWEEEWKKYFHPLRIGQKFVIKPTWENYSPAGDDIVIEIDPGMAFGTGQHHSTSMCLEAMEGIFSENNTSNWEVLDVGTGTGILGIAAARLGAERVVGLDIDEMAVDIARENALLNKVAEKLSISSRDISSLKKPFNLILANLTAKPLIELYNKLESMLTPGGYLVISGIIELNREEIEGCFARPPLMFRRELKREEWLCYVFAKE